MGKITAKEVARRKQARRTRKALIWLGVLVAAGITYGVMNSSGVRYTDRDLTVIDFTSLSPAQKKTALVAANAASCSCGCGLRLAECVVTDETCPIRSSNIERIRKMVVDAMN